MGRTTCEHHLVWLACVAEINREVFREADFVGCTSSADAPQRNGAAGFANEWQEHRRSIFAACSLSPTAKPLSWPRAGPQPNTMIPTRPICPR